VLMIPENHQEMISYDVFWWSRMTHVCLGMVVPSCAPLMIPLNRQGSWSISLKIVWSPIPSMYDKELPVHLSDKGPKTQNITQPTS
jgi:hypothetical protein